MTDTVPDHFRVRREFLKWVCNVHNKTGEKIAAYGPCATAKEAEQWAQQLNIRNGDHRPPC